MLRERHTPSSAPIPLVSVCIPAYHADRYLEATLRSIAAQTFTDWEVIVTEDGSNDRTEEIVRSFAASVRQSVLFERHERNQGLPATRNSGIASARGEWVAFLDSDDLWRPEHLGMMLTAASHTRCEMVFSGTEWFDDASGQTVLKSVPSREDLSHLPVALFTGRLSILPSSAMIRRSSFTKLGAVSTEYPHVNDTEYWLRILRNGGRIVYSGGATCLYRKHGAAMSKRVAELLVDSARLCEQYANWDAIPSRLRRQRPANLYRWAARTLLREDPAMARRVIVQAVRLQPFNAKNLGIWAKAALQRRKTPRLQAHLA
ncbi:glycosyl transferase [Opitutaceae bacterium EW11]|nr:glycosyl transferase [Opitutaceae bacterium EW11]